MSGTYFSRRFTATPEGLLDLHFYGTTQQPYGFEAKRVKTIETLTPGAAVNITPLGLARLASTNDTDRICNAIALTSDSVFLFRGYVPGNSGFAPNSQLWLSPTLGQFTTGLPYATGKFVQLCGVVAPDGALYFVYNPPIRR